MKEPTVAAAESKATIYRLLSACFYEPEDCFLEEDVFGQLATALNNMQNNIAPLPSEMEKAFRESGTDQLLLDFTALFMGPFEIPAKPYGSVYLDGEKVVMGDSTMNAKACYAEVDFAVSESFRELPDHITVELEFLYLLCFKQSEALACSDKKALTQYAEMEQQFLKNHLGRWVAEFCEQIRQHAQSDYYRHLADLTEKFILQQRG